MKRLLLVCLLAASVSRAAELRDGNGDWLRDSGSQMVFYAVLEGLFNAGVSKEHAALIFASDDKFSEHFVYSCPLCHPAVEAIRLYKAHSHFEFKKPLRWGEDHVPVFPRTFGKGLEEATAKRLESKDGNERIAVIQELIQNWVSQKLNSMRLTADERAQWTAHLEGLRKRGMASLEHMQRQSPGNLALKERKTCPACDGSVGACTIAAVPRVGNQPQAEAHNLHPDIFFAVLEELYRSGATNEDLAAIMPSDAQQKRTIFTSHFVYSCSLCHSAWEAMRLYTLRPDFFGRKDGASTFGKGLDPALAALLRNQDHSKRMEGIQQLVTLSVKNRMDRLRLIPAEKEIWTAALSKLRANGMAILESFQKNPDRGFDYSGWKFCPACDGSAESCRVNLKPKAAPMGPEF